MAGKLTKVFISESKSMDRVALGIDIRNLQGLSELGDILGEIGNVHQKPNQNQTESHI
mgnify:CR=1 FL=1